ncbi:MAG: hypothetical protein JJT94_10330 [Bernardetiaceae bacterium]|nr:hypothetical protein [Bernardetiaceae bacterium]
MQKINLYEASYATIYHYPACNAFFITWLRQANNAEYRHVLSRAIELIESYNISLWIANMQKAGIVSLENQQWFREDIVPRAIHAGIRRAGIILSEDAFNRFYLNNTIQKTKEKGFEVEFHYFNTPDEIFEWALRMKLELADQ